ncbi:hypothetical protein IscW_ISCW020329 [Ixodes scapularis]|uniref:Uncharacterized protein n=1 Tax=Ixodes scapularis TaxID=6945 RepID=B7PZW7_IXOSC|nr:hypothetical protein IscW_ISCW020329 [Ixodes scapularis]|eukprot:XP_002406281.1 hypothetical protein IscW_ISCW020329 [Ixodes scapularis]
MDELVRFARVPGSHVSILASPRDKMTKMRSGTPPLSAARNGATRAPSPLLCGCRLLTLYNTHSSSLPDDMHGRTFDSRVIIGHGATSS